MKTAFTTMTTFIEDNHKSILTFFAIGGLSALINLSTFTLIWEWRRLPYKEAVSLAYACSVLFHFTANRQVTFKHSAQTLSHQLPRYLVMISLNYLITITVAHCIVDFMALSPYLGVLGAISITGCVGFLMAKFWVFKCVL